MTWERIITPDIVDKGYYIYTIEQRDVDFTGRATHVDLTGYILRAAGDDADKNGFGVSDLNLDNCSWVLSRMCVEYFRRPVVGEQITVVTWVNEINRMMTTRNMTVTDGEGEAVAKAVTQWAVIDMDKRIALDIRQHVNYDDSLMEEPCPVEKPVRVPRLKTEPAFVKRVSYSDIDFNRHMNAMKYLEWMIDALPINCLLDREMRRMDMNFLHEARYGQQLRMAFEDGERSLFEISGEDGMPLCMAALTWSDNPAGQS